MPDESKMTTEDWIWFWVGLFCLFGVGIAWGFIIDEHLNKWLCHG